MDPTRVVAAGNGAMSFFSFSGTDARSGQPYIYVETIGGGSGARYNKDGLDAVHVHMTNTCLLYTSTSVMSALTGNPIRKDVAMTGEITLRGKVLPVGGIKEKVLAAHRAGIRTILLPRENEADIEEIPQSVRKQLTCLLYTSRCV